MAPLERALLPPPTPNDMLSASQKSDIHIRRELSVDMSEFVYSFASGMWNSRSHPDDCQPAAGKEMVDEDAGRNGSN